MTNISPRHKEDVQFYRGLREFKRVADAEAAARPAVKRFIASAQRIADKIARANHLTDIAICGGMVVLLGGVGYLIVEAISAGVPL